MKYSIFTSIFIITFTLFIHLIGCTSCVTNKANAENLPQENPNENISEPIKVKEPNPLMDNIKILDTEISLSNEAQDTYAYLSFLKALLDEDEDEVLHSAQYLKNSDLPAGLWLESGIWLMSKKSPNIITLLNYALNRWPDDISLNLLYAEALSEFGKLDFGVQHMQNFIKNHPDNIDAKIELILLLVKNKQFTEAENLLKKISPKQRNYLIEYYHARALIGMDRKKEAISYLQKAIKAKPDFTEALVELAFIYEQLNQLRDAKNVYEKILKQSSFDHQDITLRLINISLALKEPENALKYLQSGPNNISFKLSAAGMFIGAKHFLQAENILKSVAESKNPPNDVFIFLADLTFMQYRDANKSLEWIDKVPENSKNAPRAALIKSQILAETGKLEEATKLVIEKRKKFPNDIELAECEIRILARANKMDEALKAAKKASEKWKTNTDILFILGSILDEVGNKKEALEVMENLLSIQPDNYQALNYIGYTLAEQEKNLDRAIDLLTLANKLSPNQAYIIDSLAWALFKSGKKQAALNEIRKAVNIDQNTDPTIWEHYGEIALSLGMNKEAKKAYQKALDLNPSNADDIRKKLSKL